MIWLISFAVLWVLCFVLSTGWAYAYFETEYEHVVNKKGNKKFAYAVSIAGPLSVIITLQQTDWAKHGWRWPE